MDAEPAFARARGRGALYVAGMMVIVCVGASELPPCLLGLPRVHNSNNS